MNEPANEPMMATIPQQSAAKQKGKGGLSIEPTTTARLSTRSTARPTWQVQSWVPGAFEAPTTCGC